MSKYLFLLTTICLSLAFAPAPFPKPDPSKDDPKKIQGQWMRIRYTQGAYTEEGPTGSVITVTGQRLKYEQSNTQIGDYTFALDTKKKPKVLDFTCIAGVAKGLVYRGLYRLEGDTLTLCYRQSAAESDRPTAFDASKEGVVISVYKRQKR
jgi:uncharacterized protein (TIGR03067 family)